MVIDIIDYTETQLSYLSVEQLEEVRSAQLKKNTFLKRQQELCTQEKFRLLKNGTFMSALYAQYCTKIENEYAQKVEEVRQALLFYLQYTSRPDGTGDQFAPYVVNYALPMEQRLDIVRGYYETQYTDEQSIERFEVFKQDKVAIVYLGEYYGSVYSIYRSRAENQEQGA